MNSCTNTNILLKYVSYVQVPQKEKRRDFNWSTLITMLDTCIYLALVTPNNILNLEMLFGSYMCLWSTCHEFIL